MWKVHCRTPKGGTAVTTHHTSKEMWASVRFYTRGYRRSGHYPSWVFDQKHQAVWVDSTGNFGKWMLKKTREP